MCTPEANLLLDIQKNANPLLIFEGTTNLNELVKHFCDQTTLYATKHGRVCCRSLRKKHIFKYQLYHVNLKASKREMLLKC